MKSIAFGFLATAIVAASAIAGTPDFSKDKTVAPLAPPCFRDQELQLDIFGSYLNLTNDGRSGWDHRGRHDDRDGGGGGVGVNYFFMRYLGVGVDGSLNSNRGGLWDYTGKVIVRYPLDLGHCCIAPYVFGGGGGQSDGTTVGAWMVGGGLEYRATPHIGIFAEGRYTWTDHGNDDSHNRDRGLNGDNAQARLGLRIAF